jgi:hypothetical protein
MLGRRLPCAPTSFIRSRTDGSKTSVDRCGAGLRGSGWPRLRTRVTGRGEAFQQYTGQDAQRRITRRAERASANPARLAGPADGHIFAASPDKPAHAHDPGHAAAVGFQAVSQRVMRPRKQNPPAGPAVPPQAPSSLGR